MRANERLRVIVCGTTFGRVYLRGIRRLSERFELAGILARGSAHSRACAQQYGVPLYTSVEELPVEDIDMACVVVRSSVVGGVGTDLAVGLLERGIHVLQEHPVHQADLVNCLKTARTSQARYALNSFYPDLYFVRQFIRAAKRALENSRAVTIDATCGINVLYPLLDILGQIFQGFRPWSFSAPLESSTNTPLTSLDGTLAGVPLRLGIQNSMSAKDPDNSGLLLHRISLYTENGTLLLPDTHGPVLWVPRMYVERDKDGVMDMFGDSPFTTMPAMQMQEDFQERTYGTIFRDLWPEAVQRSLLRFEKNIREGVDDTQRGQYSLTACRVWQELGQRLGVSNTVELKPPQLEKLERRA